jgi:transposase
MEKRTAEQITDEILRLVKRCGVDPVELVEALMGPFHAAPEEMAMAREGFRSVFVSRLQGQPEPSREDLARLMVGFRTSAFSLRKALLERARALPAERGGRPKLLTKNQEAELNARISEQLSQGVEKTDAIRSAAAKYGVSVWTAKRAWQRFQTSIRVRPRAARKPRPARPKRRS